MSELNNRSQEDQAERDRLVEEVAAMILEVPRTTTLEFYIRVGGIIFERIYRSDLKALRTNAGKRVSFKRLSTRLSKEDRSGFSAVSLHRMVDVFELDRRLHVSAWKAALTPNHVRTVLSLSDDEQARLLPRAAAEGWTHKRLKEAVAELRRAAPEPRIGRPPLPRFLRAARAVGRAHGECKPDLFEDLDQIADLTRDETAELLAMLERVQTDCSMLRVKIVVSSQHSRAK